MYKCNANHHPSVHSLHVGCLLTRPPNSMYVLYLRIRVCVYILEGKPKALPNTSPEVCTLLCYAAPFLPSQLPLIHAHSTITLCLLRNGDNRENDREAETVNKHSEHSTTKCENKFTECSFLVPVQQWGQEAAFLFHRIF